MDTEINLGEEAVRLAKLGYAVFPCYDPKNDKSPDGKKGKKPLTPHGVMDATTDLDTIAQWWTQWPTANIGLACQNCLVLDLDDKDGKCGSDDIKMISAELGELSPASVALTGSGGQHYFFAKPDVEISGQTTAKWKDKPTGIDIRIGNQYVIAAPSIHESGKRYSWSSPLIPPKELTPLPQAWIDDFLPHKNTVQPVTPPLSIAPVTDDLTYSKAARYLDAIPPAIQGQNGSRQLYWAATAMLWKFGLDEETTRQFIRDFYNPRCDPPWSEKEIDHKIKDAKSRPPQNLAKWEAERNDLVRLAATDIPGIVAQARAMTDTPTETEEPFTIYTHEELLKKDLTPHFLIQDVLVEDQPMIVGGPKKCLKTSILLDMAVSLGSGHAFLDKFKVVKPCKVLVMSGESGLATILNAVNRIQKRKSLQWRQNIIPSMERFLKSGVIPIARNVLICDSVPHITSQEHLGYLETRLETEKPDVIIFDPAYLMMDGEKAENVMNMGLQLRQITLRCKKHGATMVLAHHFTKSAGNETKMPDLNDLAWSGFAEFARQWILLNRRERYKSGSGCHNLNMLIGGSVGFGNEYHCQILEGKYPDRHWLPTVTFNEEADTAEEPALPNNFTVNGQPVFLPTSEQKTVLDFLKKNPNGVSKTKIKGLRRIGKKVDVIMEQLTEAAQVRVTSEKRSGSKSAEYYYPVSQSGEDHS